MPLAITKGRERTGKKPSCTCGRCTKCLTRDRVFKWREGQKHARAQEIEKILMTEREEEPSGD